MTIEVTDPWAVVALVCFILFVSFFVFCFGQAWGWQQGFEFGLREGKYNGDAYTLKGECDIYPENV